KDRRRIQQTAVVGRWLLVVGKTNIAKAGVFSLRTLRIFFAISAVKGFKASLRHKSSSKNKTAGTDPCRRLKVNAYFPRFTAFFNSAPGVNFATRRAAILMVAPVCGLRPLRAFRCEIENVPNPIRATRSPFFSA